MPSPERLPPGQREVRKWPRLDLGIVPRFDPKSWDLRVDGAVERPPRVTYDEPPPPPAAPPPPLERGGPARLVVPKRYAWKSAKWLRRITFTEVEELGYWEVRGDSNTADPWTGERYA